MSDIVERYKARCRESFSPDSKEGRIASELNGIAMEMCDEIERLRAQIPDREPPTWEMIDALNVEIEALRAQIPDRDEPEYKAAIENAIKTMEWATITLGSERPSYEAMQAAIKVLRGTP